MIEDDFVKQEGWLEPVVYALWSRGKCVYIGQSTQPLIRLFQHRLKNGERIARQNSRSRTIERFPFDEIWMRTCTLAEIDNLEKDMIFKYQPKHNIAHKDNPRIPIDISDIVKALLPVSNNVHPMLNGKLERRI